MLNEGVNSVHALSLMQLCSVMDGNFEEMENIANYLAMSKDVKKLASLKSVPRPKAILTIREVLAERKGQN